MRCPNRRCIPRAVAGLALMVVGLLAAPPAAHGSWEEVKDFRGQINIRCTAEFTMSAGEMTVTVNRSGRATITVTGIEFDGAYYRPVGRITGNLENKWHTTYHSGGGGSGSFSGAIDRTFSAEGGAAPKVQVNREAGLYVISLPHCRAEGTATISAMSGTRTKDGARDEIQPHVPDRFRIGANPRVGESYDPESGVITGIYTTTVEETIGSSFYGFTFSGPVTVSANWHFETKRPKLKADAGGPYTAKRGGTLDLDGSRSTGWITEYRWAFLPAGGCLATARFPEAGKTGVTATVVPLCSMLAILTVTDGENVSSDSAAIRMTSRDWATRFIHEPDEVELEDGKPPWAVLNHPEESGYLGGANLCADDATQNEYHNFHPPAVSGSWDGRGYVLRQVEDPGGPFHQWWYVGEYALIIHRVTAINRYLLPGGRPPMSEMEPFYDYNEAQGMDVAGYLQAIRDHEYEHSRRKQAALKANDPGPLLEKDFSRSREELKEKIDQIIQQAEKAICAASADPLPLSWRGELWFPLMNTGRYEVKSVVEVGGMKQIHEDGKCGD